MPTGGIARHNLFARSILCWRIPRTKSNGIHSPSIHCLPHLRQVESFPYHGVKKESSRVLFLQSGQVSTITALAVALGAWMCMCCVMATLLGAVKAILSCGHAHSSAAILRLPGASRWKCPSLHIEPCAARTTVRHQIHLQAVS